LVSHAKNVLLHIMTYIAHRLSTTHHC